MPSPFREEVNCTSASAAVCFPASARAAASSRLAFARLEFVALGQHQAIGDGCLVQQRHHLAVAVHHPAPRIDQRDDPSQARPAAQIGEDHLLPGLGFGLGPLGEAVTGQVHQHQPPRQVEEIDLAGGRGISFTKN